MHTAYDSMGNNGIKTTIIPLSGLLLFWLDGNGDVQVMEVLFVYYTCKNCIFKNIFL